MTTARILLAEVRQTLLQQGLHLDEVGKAKTKELSDQVLTVIGKFFKFTDESILTAEEMQIIAVLGVSILATAISNIAEIDKE